MTNSFLVADEQRLLLDIVRGRVHWRELGRLGVTPGLDASPPTWQEPASVPITVVRLGDLATGFVAHLSSPQDLQEWAQAIEMCGCFDLASLEGNPAGELLLDALWSASYVEPIAVDTVEVIQSIADGWSAEGAEPRSIAPAASPVTPRRP